MPGAVSSNQTQSRIPAAVGMRAELPGPLAEGVVMELALLCAVCALGGTEHPGGPSVNELA